MNTKLALALVVALGALSGCFRPYHQPGPGGPGWQGHHGCPKHQNCPCPDQPAPPPPGAPQAPAR